MSALRCLSAGVSFYLKSCRFLIFGSGSIGDIALVVKCVAAMTSICQFPEALVSTSATSDYVPTVALLLLQRAPTRATVGLRLECFASGLI